MKLEIAVAVLAAALVVHSAGSAEAQLCVPQVGYMPGMDPGPPDWLDPANGKDDVRWKFALRQAFGYFRGGLRSIWHETGGQKFVNLSFTGPVGGATTTLEFAFIDESAGTGKGWELSLATGALLGGSSPGVATGGSPQISETREWTYASSAWTSAIGGDLPAAAVSSARLWVECTSSPGCTAPELFTLQMRMPVDSAVGVADGDFRAWFGMLESLPTALSAMAQWPEGAKPVGTLPAPTAMQPMKIATSSTGCQANLGLTANNQLTTDHHDGEIRFTGDTEFRINPLNVSPSESFDPNDVQAKVRIANWGTTGLSSPDWDDVCTAQATATGSVAPGSTVPLRCDWSPSDPCIYQNNGVPGCDPGDVVKDDHQCIFAELQRPGTGGTVAQVVFQPDSRHRNMYLTPASVVERDAMVSVRGLSALPGKTERAVYLQVRKWNMPEPADEGKDPMRMDVDRLLKRYGERGLPFEQMIQAFPTFLVRAFHETGEVRDGRTILNEQPSFGLHLYHRGDFLGWLTSLTGAGITEVAPDFYKLEVPNDDSVSLKVRVQALTPCESSCGDADAACLERCDCEAACAPGDGSCVDKCFGERPERTFCERQPWLCDWRLILFLLALLALLAFFGRALRS